MAKFEITWLEDRSDEAVLQEIRRVAALDPSLRLTRDMFNSRSKIKSSAVERRFGSWSEATRRAGLNNALPVYSDTAIIEDLRRVSDFFQGGPFTISLYVKRGLYSRSIIKRRFGGWRQALEAAGVGHRFGGPPTTERMKSQPGRVRTDEQILGEIRDISVRLGKVSLSGADIEANSEITQAQLYRRFGGVSAALKQAGIEQAHRGRRYTEDEIFENLLEVWTHYGRSPTALEMDRPPSRVGQMAYIRRYGGWRKALKAFVDRANSEVDGPPPVDPKRDPTSQTDQTGQAENRTAGMARRRPDLPPFFRSNHTYFCADLGEQVRPTSQLSARPRTIRRTPTEVKPPEDRRGPSIGLRFRVLQRDHFKCVLCGDHPARNVECVLHVDHIVPWSRGGKTREDNLRTLCATCNVGRGNRFDN